MLNKTLFFFLWTFAYGLVLLVVTYIHNAFFTVNVVLYDAIKDAILSVLITGIAFFTLGRFRKIFNGFEKILLIVFWLLGGFTYAITIPTVIDRSLSFYILEKINQRGGKVQQAKINDIFIKEYVIEHRLMDVRLTEQLESGTIALSNGCVVLTPKGKRVIAFSQFYRHHLLPKKRLLLGEYSADLTNPFRNSVKDVDYLCD